MNDVQLVEAMQNSRFEQLPTLNNLPPGYLLIGMRPMSEPYLLMILACNPEKEYQPFVVWTYNRSLGWCSHGRYYQTLEAAEQCFTKDPEFA